MISPLDPGSVQRGTTQSPGQSQVVALRVAIIGAVLLGLFAIVFFRLWYLQVLSGNSLAAQASNNRKRVVPITAPRGDILDRRGNVLVRNRRAQIVELAPSSLPEPERVVAAEYGKSLSDWATRIINAHSADKFAKWSDEGFPESIRLRFPKPRIPALNDPKVIEAYDDAGEPEELPKLRQRYERLAGVLRLSPDEVRRRVIKSLYLLPYAAIPLLKEAPKTIVWYIAENAELFPGVSTTQRYVRSYPHGEAAAQLFGQVGAVPIDPDTGKATYRKYEKLNPAAQVGLNGLELQYDTYLRGSDGEVQSTVDAAGNVIGEPVVKQPRSGDQLQLTLDLDLTERARKSLAVGSQFNPYGRPGAIVALDPRDGAVLAMASNPSFNPAEFVRGVSDEQFQRFITDSGGKPLFNRAIQGGYPAASTFKPVTAFAALANGKIAPDTIVNDGGKVTISDQEFKNAGAAANGAVDLKRAMQVSSDVYFYLLGASLNTLSTPQPLQQWARRFGFGKPTGIDVPGEYGGIIPDIKWRADKADEETDCRRREKIPQNADVYTAGRLGCGISDKRPWSIGDNVQLAIGQGDVSVTPLQSAVLYAAIANGGTIVRPHLARSILDRRGGTKETFDYPARDKIDLAGTGGLEAIRSGLFAAANEPGGTSAGVFGNWPVDRYPIFGKTGTAERVGKEDQSWYAAYVPDEQRPIVVVATVEEGGFGAQTAAPIVGQMLAQWYGVTDAKITAGKSSTR